MGGYYKPFGPNIKRGQRFGANPGWGPNPAGGHNGDDYLSQVGEPVYAAGDGVVVFAGRFDSTYADNFGWNLNFGGQMVVLNLDGPDGPYVEYGHNSELLVSTGDRVRAGQAIALSGEDDGGTHVITGPHLHVGCLPPNFDLNTPTYGRVNPDIYLTEYWDGGTISTQSTTVTKPQEEDMASFTDDIIHDKDGGETTPEKLYNSLDTKVSRTEGKLDILLGLLGVQLEDPTEPGKTYALADWIVWGATNAKLAAGSAGRAVENTDPAALARAVARGSASVDAAAIAEKLTVSVREAK